MTDGFYTYEEAQRIIKSHDIFDVMMQLHPDRLDTASGRWRRFLCPKHSDGNNGSLLVTPANKICCMAGCQFNGMSSADAADLLIDQIPSVRNIYDAARWLSGTTLVQYTADELKKKQQRQSKVKWHPTINDVNKYHMDYRDALPYYTSRGLTEETVIRWKLGMKKSHCMTDSRTFKSKDQALKIERQPVHRYTIPYVMGDVVRMIRLRRDDDDARERWALMKGTTVYNNVMQLADQREKKADQNGKVYNRESDIIDILFGDKYITFGSQRNRIYGANHIALLVDGTIQYRKHSVVAWHEGEFDAMLFEQETGIPSISDNAGSVHLPALLQNVDVLMMVIDNGEAGKQIANRVLSMSQRTLGKDAFILMPISGCKDTTDMVAKHNTFKQYVSGAISLWNSKSSLSGALCQISHKRVMQAMTYARHQTLFCSEVKADSLSSSASLSKYRKAISDSSQTAALLLSKKSL